MEIILIRHGMTKGNKTRKFIGGKTDEPVCAEGKEMLKKRAYEPVEMVFTSPMLRCRQTAQEIYPKQKMHVVETFRECDFGILEGKNHKELSGMKEYELFLKSGGKLPFPGGEAVEIFNQRSVDALSLAITKAKGHKAKKIACVVHGGTIMAIMNCLVPEQSYYDWNVENGEGYRFLLSEEQWRKKAYGTALISDPLHRIYT